MAVDSFFVRHGRPTIYKNPGSRLLYGVNLRDWLGETGTTLLTVDALPEGVNVDGAAFIQGAAVCAWVTGLDLAEGATNSCRFMFTCADGSEDEVTIYFVKRPG